MLLGAIDVGTNSIHLVVVELDPEYGTSRTILKEREMVRLGAGDALSRGMLSKKAIVRGVAAIARFAEHARAAGALDVRAVATSAVREAENRDEFLGAVRAAAGLEVEVASETEEARLIHLGVARGFSFGDRVGCIIDIGGGSTEFIVADRDRPYFLGSIRLGSLRLYGDHCEGREAAGDARPIVALGRAVREGLAGLAVRMAGYRFDVVIGTSGTIMGLATLDAAERGLPPQRPNGYVLELGRLRALQATMLRLGPVERKKMPGMNPRRSDIIVAGNAILIGALEMLRRDEIVVCERALREGIVVDYLERNVAHARRLGDERRRRFDAATALARRFGVDHVHGRHVAALAVQLFDATQALHALEPADRDLLFIAGVLHDLGRAIAASGHHKHGAYIVQHAQLPEFRPGDTTLIAALVRYHRKALPKPTHLEWASASPFERDRIERLGGLLRVAEALDRRHIAAVHAVAAVVETRGLRIDVTSSESGRRDGESGALPEIEAAQSRSDLLARAFARPIFVVPAAAAGRHGALAAETATRVPT